MTPQEKIVEIRCPKCREVFVNDSELMRHFFYRHARTAKGYKNICPICQDEVGNFQYHCAKFHNTDVLKDGTGVYRCFYCPRVFFNTLSLRAHNAKKHNRHERLPELFLEREARPIPTIPNPNKLLCLKCRIAWRTDNKKGFCPRCGSELSEGIDFEEKVLITQ